jgi:hypothetical protein
VWYAHPPLTGKLGRSKPVFALVFKLLPFDRDVCFVRVGAGIPPRTPYHPSSSASVIDLAAIAGPAMDQNKPAKTAFADIAIRLSFKQPLNAGELPKPPSTG